MTVSISEEARRLLKVGAANEDATPGMVLDRLIKAAYGVAGTTLLPAPQAMPTDPMPPPATAAPTPEPEAKAPQAPPTPFSKPSKADPWLTADEVQRTMDRLRLTQTAIANSFRPTITPKAVSGWLKRGQIPPDRQTELWDVLESFQLGR
jgi:hypothetical protein